MTEHAIENELRKAAFEQNHASFRSLNQQMWQIPLIAMSLTGGLWFGVSRVETYPLFQIALLFLAAVGNFALVLVLQRLRFVMGEYLGWLERNFAPGFVKAEGNKWYNRSFVVRTSFQGMLCITAAISIGLLIMTIREADLRTTLGVSDEDAAAVYYQRHAADLADGYEALTFEAAHPSLASIVATELAGKTLRVLDVGAGTGRDAAWFSGQGHEIVAVEPSAAMRIVGKRRHVGLSIDWRDDKLPVLAALRASGEEFDLIVASAVWMHIKPEDRQEALQSLMSLLDSGGLLYLTLRLGPEEPKRGIFKVSLEGFKETASSLGLQVAELETQTDLLGRSHIHWQALTISSKK